MARPDLHAPVKVARRVAKYMSFLYFVSMLVLLLCFASMGNPHTDLVTLPFPNIFTTRKYAYMFITTTMLGSSSLILLVLVLWHALTHKAYFREGMFEIDHNNDHEDPMFRPAVAKQEKKERRNRDKQIDLNHTTADLHDAGFTVRAPTAEPVATSGGVGFDGPRSKRNAGGGGINGNNDRGANAGGAGGGYGLAGGGNAAGGLGDRRNGSSWN